MMHKTCSINYGHLANLQKTLPTTDLNKKNFHLIKISFRDFYFFPFFSICTCSSLGPFCWRVLSDCAITWVPLHSDRPTWEIIWKKYFLHLIFTFYLNTDASVVEFFTVVVFQQKGRSFYEVGVTVDPIYWESKPSLNCWIAVERAEVKFISKHIIANQTSYHDDRST